MHEKKMKKHKQYVVYQEQRPVREEIFRYPIHTVLAGPFDEEAQAEASAKGHWKRGQRTFVREIGDTSGLFPVLPTCACCSKGPDPECLVGPYLHRRATDLEALAQHPGMLFLPAGLQRQVVKQQARWQGKYLRHLREEKQ